MKIGEKIAMIRKLRGMKQEALASMLGTNQSTISAIEKRDDVSESNLQDIAEILEVSPDYIKWFNPNTILEIINKEPIFIHIRTFTDDDIDIKNFLLKDNFKEMSFNPLEKITELYKRLLVCEQEKVKILKSLKKQGRMAFTSSYEQSKKIVQNIEFVRVLKGISLAELGENLEGISKQAVSKMLQKRKINTEKLIKIADILKVTPDSLKNMDMHTIMNYQNSELKSIEDIFIYFENCIKDQQAIIKNHLENGLKR